MGKRRAWPEEKETTTDVGRVPIHIVNWTGQCYNIKPFLYDMTAINYNL
jgi:hypothetical protein